MNDYIAFSAYFGAALTLIIYVVSFRISDRIGHPLANPILICLALLIGALLIFDIDYDAYNQSARYITYLLTPATVCLALPLYRQIQKLREYPLAIVAGILTGVAVNALCVLAVALVFQLGHYDFVTLIPKSVTGAVGMPLAEELGLDKKGGCILSYNGGKIVDCRTGETLVEKTLDPALVPELCDFAAAQDIAILTYNREGIVCERDKDEWANKECFTTKLPMIHVDDLASYVNYPVCKMLITLDPARRDAVCAAGQQQFAGRADLYPSSPFFIEAVPLGVAKDGSLAELLRRMGLTRENLMACGDGLNDRSMIAYAGVGVAMQNAEQPVKDCADYVTTADNNHDGVAEAVEKFILRED